MMAKRQSKYPWYFKYIKSRVDEVWGWSPQRKRAKQRAHVGTDEAGNDHWKCEECGAAPLYKGQYEVDHMTPRIPVEGWDSWDGFIARSLDMTAEELRVLCKPCHKRKSGSENKRRPRKGAA